MRRTDLWFARLWPLALFVVIVVLMVRNAIADPYDPTLVGTDRYGHNHEGALGQMLAWSTCELVALYLVLTPGFRRSIARATLALVLFGAWTVLSAIATMHAGRIVALHALWLLAVCCGVMVTLFARIVRRDR